MRTCFRRSAASAQRSPITWSYKCLGRPLRGNLVFCIPPKTTSRNQNIAWNRTWGQGISPASLKEIIEAAHSVALSKKPRRSRVLIITGHPHHHWKLAFLDRKENPFSRGIGGGFRCTIVSTANRKASKKLHKKELNQGTCLTAT